MPTQAEIFLAVTKSSLESITKQTGELITMVSEMGLLDIEGSLRQMFEDLMVLTAEVGNYDEAYLVKRQTMYLLQKAMEKDALAEYNEFWDGRPEKLIYIPRKEDTYIPEKEIPSKGKEDLL